MAMFKKLGFFGAPLIVLLAGAGATTACDGAEVCGPCGEVLKGDVGISGSAKLDGFFAAVSQLNNAVVTASADFELGLANLEAAFGVTAEGDLSARVDAINAAITAEIQANAEAGLTVNVSPAKCEANVSVAVEAQVNCEAKAECDVEVDPGKVSVECSGQCEGSCEGGCEGTATCKASAGGIECSGKCEGSCELEAAATCEGTCHGECSGECSAYAKNGEGNAECAGSCDGECTGTCELSVAAECSGSCTGSCEAELPAAECEAEVKCEGKCEGSCSGGCTGEATPPSASADCEASAECKGQAKAQASASLTCTPPSIEVGFAFSGSADAQASFIAKMGALKANAGLMIQSFTKYEALFNGKVNGEVVFNPTPVAAVTAGLEGVAELVASGDLVAEVPAGKIECLVPAFSASIDALGDIGAEAAGTLSAQASFVTAFSGGFEG